MTLNLTNIKSNSLRYNRSVIYEIDNNFPEKKQMNVTRHQIFFHPAEIIHDKTYLIDYTSLKSRISFQNSVELDSDGMQGYIIGIFEREED